MVLEVLFNILGIVAGIAILAIVGKAVFMVVKELLSYVWQTIHKPSFDKFKIKIKKTKNKNIK